MYFVSYTWCVPLLATILAVTENKIGLLVSLAMHIVDNINNPPQVLYLISLFCSLKKKTAERCPVYESSDEASNFFLITNMLPPTLYV